MPIWDPLVPAERFIQRGLARLPPVVSHWLGYRGKPSPSSHTWVVCLWGFIGAFGGLSIILAIFGHTEYFRSRAVPPIIASFGASAILCYGAIDVPLAQPRSLIFGHFFSGLVGVIVATIFQFNLEDDPFPRLQWLAASLATAIALVVMHLTKTTHPPAGATALLPCIDQHIWALRWYFLPVLLLSSSIVLVTSLMVNNIQRQYPKFWVAQIPPPPPVSKEDSHRHRKPAMAEDSSVGSPHSALRDLESGP
ncbi:HPP-domain-containing protein [Clathrospora elynae]|uniref:HPP-domain-containing protein n=1 Tax=Clathrospora elynae TaxID=706981 RepID=A0A6A5SSC8_9PLEO|nr:HPP-domain-containing protein [Clathrospora elynae]